MSLLLLGLCSCQNLNRQHCESLSWRSEGEKIGKVGQAASKINQLKKICAKFEFPFSEQEYQEGYQSGLSNFCEIEKGFKLGESGAIYNNECSSLTGEDFSNQYKHGRLKFLKSELKTAQTNLREAEERVWRKGRQYLLESTYDTDAAQMAKDQLESYREEVRELTRKNFKLKKEVSSLVKETSKSDPTVK